MAVQGTVDQRTETACIAGKEFRTFGKGNTKPVFAARNVKVLNGKVLGKNRNVLKMQVQDTAGTVIEAMLFQKVEEFLKEIEDVYGTHSVEMFLQGRQADIRLALTYYPDINEYMGRKTPQIVISHYRFAV